MSLMQNLQWRYATKKFDSQKTVPQEKIDYLLDATRLSASSFGLQPYKILVVKDKSLREQMVPHAWGQTQLTDSTCLVVFAAWSTIDEQQVNDFIADMAAKRGIPVESLNDYRGMILGKVTSTPQKDLQEWAARQCYIALGTLLAAAAEQHVDATPMEGFDPAAVDKILGLDAKGLKSVLLCPLGYRSEQDWLAPLPKVRRDKDKLVEII